MTNSNYSLLSKKKKKKGREREKKNHLGYFLVFTGQEA